MKKILGLDLGTGSIGWAVVNEAETVQEQSSIVKLGVRTVPLTVDEQNNFESGKSITTNADRTMKRGMRRNLQRYKLRRKHLVDILEKAGLIDEKTVLAEIGSRTTFQTLRLRARAADEEIGLDEFARVLLSINKKRGYKSSRKADKTEDGTLVDGMEVAKCMYDNNLTPGEYVCSLFGSKKMNIPDFYRSDLKAEFNRIWDFQSRFYPDILTPELRSSLDGKSGRQTWAICQAPFGIEGMKRTAKGKEKDKENYFWRRDALSERLDLERLAVVFQEINAQIAGSSGYLGGISDRSKELFFNHMTVGQWLVAKLDENPNFSLKNQVFYRQDYLDEFETIWEMQARFHPELTPDLKHEIRDVAIFYQRNLKSQKGLVSLCEFEKREIEVEQDGRAKTKTVGLKVCPKSSPLFQEFRIWQTVNNLLVDGHPIEQAERQRLFRELSVRSSMSGPQILKLLYANWKELSLNFEKVGGNSTMSAIVDACKEIVLLTGHEVNFKLMKTEQDAYETVERIFKGLGYNTAFLHFDSSLQGKDMENQDSYRLWHLLYSYTGDNSKTGTDKLVKAVSGLTGMEPEYAKVLAGITFPQDYGSLSAKAIRKILPFLAEGETYDRACALAGYRHSKSSLTKEEILRKEYRDRLELLPRNSLRNPVVEKILNQMVNVVNAVIDTYGKPDEIRVELARELKKSAREREEMSAAISRSSKENEEYASKLKNDFGIPDPSRNDIQRLRLYLELKDNGFKTLYSNTYIPEEELFSKKFDIEHIIPQAKLFDDSFSNKTLEARQVNISKADMTALDFVSSSYGEEGERQYKARVEHLYKSGAISKGKYRKLLTREADIPEDFVERDLRDTQYIAKKALHMLGELVASVVPTTGSVTARLRDDWQLTNVMRQLNWDKYSRLGLTRIREDRDGRRIPEIEGWTKRNDHRHHAMDALTVAFTKRSYIQYLNNLNARIEKSVDDNPLDLSDYSLDDIPAKDRSRVVHYIEKTQLYRDANHKLRFLPPMSLDVFRNEAMKALSEILVSIKAKNKVVTRNTNITKTKGGENRRVQLTPRGKLHNETVYGRSLRYCTKEEKVGPSFDAGKIATVASPRFREALMRRLSEAGGDPKKAFGGKNSLEKNPLYLDPTHTAAVPSKVKTVWKEQVFTIRKPVSPDLKLDKVVDMGVYRVLQARLAEYGGDPAKAFSNLDENPIWLNKEKGIAVKSVRIRAVNNAEPLHRKRDNLGRGIVGQDGRQIPADYVQTSNNHHIAIYQDENGDLQEQVVSFFEATSRAVEHLPVVDKDYRRELGWKFLFTMKQNEYFVFPDAASGFDPSEIDLTDPANYALISPHLFRVQNFSTKDYWFRHHLETQVDDIRELKDTAWIRIRTVNNLKGIVKVRVNHLGQIVQVGEY